MLLSDNMRMNLLILVVTVLIVAACADSPPPIGKALPKLMTEAKPAFDKRVKERFPVGSNESAFLAEMGRENFTVTPGSAVRDISGFPCRRTWAISWSAKDGKIIAIESDYDQTCL